jgi:hypothetical protein
LLSYGLERASILGLGAVSQLVEEHILRKYFLSCKKVNEMATKELLLQNIFEL